MLQKRYWYVGVGPKTTDVRVLKELLDLLATEKETEKVIYAYLELYHLCSLKTFLAIWNHPKIKQIKSLPLFDIKSIVEYPVMIGIQDGKYQYGTLYEYFPPEREATKRLKLYKRTLILTHLVHEAIIEKDLDTLEELQSFLLLMPCYQWVIPAFFHKDDQIKSRKKGFEKL